MTEARFSTQRLLALRKLTRAIADLLRGQLRDHLVTLAPLFRPVHVFGEYVQSSTSLTVKGADRNFKELQTLYASIAGSKEFDLSRELRPPLEVLSSAPEIVPVEYTYVAHSGGSQKSVQMTSPLKWMITYAGFPPARFRELLAQRKKGVGDLPQFLLHYLLVQSIVSKQSGLANILGDLHFPVVSGQLEGFGNVPLSFISSSISTLRPPDDVIMESTEISGMNVFEEIVKLEDISAIRDPLKDRLLELVRGHGEDLPQD